MNCQKNHFFSSLLLITLISCQSLFAQSSDDLFKQARNAAFDKKDYALATQFSKEALDKSPDYSDVQIFLGRVYTWWGKNDSARNCFHQVLDLHPENEDASAAFADLEYWNNNSLAALSVSENGLKFHPESKTLLMKKAKCLIDLKRFREAAKVLSDLLQKDSKNIEVRSALENLKELNANNKIGVSYDFVTFDKQYDNPWHLVSVDYTKSTKIGSITGRINYANRFKTNGIQFETDVYPRISKTFYSHVNAGISNKNSVFPQYRAGFSLYANLPNGFEAEGGFRYLYFNDATWIYTASMGKYFKNYWFNLRTYLTPSSNAVSNSYSFTTRYYFKETDYFGIGLGTGISPDETANNIQLHDPYKLKSYRISADYRKTFQRMNIILLSCSMIQQEYLPKEIGNQYLLSLTYQRRF